MDFIALFKEKMNADGITPPDEIIPDGEIHRFHVDGDSSGSLNGWYVLHDGEMPSGAYGCWKRGLNISWCLKDKKRMTPHERATHSNRLNIAKKAHNKTYESAQEKALEVWDKAETANNNHPYLIKKKVQAYNLKLANKNELIIPIHDKNGILHSLQFINNNGEKKFLSGGKISGNYFLIGNAAINGKIYIAEGYATCMTISGATNCAVVCAFNCGNLLAVSRIIKEKYPDSEIIIAADNDTYTPQNPGLTKGNEAAKLIQANLIYPDFDGLNLQTKPTDFNDLMLLSGLDAVKVALMNTISNINISFKQYQPFNDSLPPIEDIPYEALPEIMASYINENSIIRGCPPDYILVSLLARLGCIFAGKVKIAMTRNSDWHTSPNFFWLLIGEVSSGKSNAYSLTNKHIQQFELEAREKYADEIQSFNDHMDILARQLNALQKSMEKECRKQRRNKLLIDQIEDEIKTLKIKIRSIEKEKPKLKRYIICKITIEKMILVLQDNPEGVMLEVDEITPFFMRLSKDEYAEERGIYLSEIVQI